MHEIHPMVCLVFDPTDPHSKRRAHQLIKTLIANVGRKSWGEYRTHLVLTDQIANPYSWNNHAQMKLNKAIKNALDPRGILTSGKTGIWPESYDEKAWAVPEGMTQLDGHCHDHALAFSAPLYLINFV